MSTGNITCPVCLVSVQTGPKWGFPSITDFTEAFLELPLDLCHIFSCSELFQSYFILPVCPVEPSPSCRGNTPAVSPRLSLWPSYINSRFTNKTLKATFHVNVGHKVLLLTVHLICSCKLLQQQNNRTCFPLYSYQQTLNNFTKIITLTNNKSGAAQLVSSWVQALEQNVTYK